MELCDKNFCDKFFCEAEKREEEVFNAPMPWVGVYIATASLLCTLAMAADVYLGFRHKKLWFPCKIFTLNAASLTLLSISIKITMDLTNPNISGINDQLARLSSMVFMYTIMSNLMPSLGPMKTTELITNLAAFTILLVTMLGNIFVQLYSTSKFWKIWQYFVLYAILIMFFMLDLFVRLYFCALTNLATTRYINLKRPHLQKIASSLECDQTGKFCIVRIKREVNKYRIMAETGSPQFVIARSVVCSASGANYFLLSLLLFAVEFLLFFFTESNPLLSSHSTYKWSTLIILVIQTIGIAVGTIPSAFRCINVAKLLSSREKREKFKSMSKANKYCTRMLVQWKESHIPLNMGSQNCRKFLNFMKNLFLSFCIKVNSLIVTISKSQLLFSVYLILPFLTCCGYCRWLSRKLISKGVTNTQSNYSATESIGEVDFSSCVLLLEGENELSKGTLNRICETTDDLIRMGRKQQPKQLLELLKASTSFIGVTMFDNQTIPSLGAYEASNSWMLPVVTLASVAMALPNILNAKVKWLLCSVGEGIQYIKIVEKDLFGKEDATIIRDTPESVWLGVELYGKWLDHDLRKMASKELNSKGSLKKLSNIAKNYVMEFKSENENTTDLPVKVIAANSMYRVTQTLLLDYDNEDLDENLFNKVCMVIADILAACLTNIPRVIILKCVCNKIKMREESAQQAARLLGKVEEILKLLEQRTLPRLDQDQATRINEWRDILDEEHHLSSTSRDHETDCIVSSE